MILVAWEFGGEVLLLPAVVDDRDVKLELLGATGTWSPYWYMLFKADNMLILTSHLSLPIYLPTQALDEQQQPAQPPQCRE